MTNVNQAARQLQIALESIGSPAELDRDTLKLRSLGVEVRIAELDVREGAAIVLYDLASLGKTEDGITILSVGYGDTPARAFAEAAFQWTTGVFTVVRHWLAPSQHTCFVEDMHMIVRAHDPDEEFGWRVHIGPVLSRAFGPDQEDAPMPAGPLDVVRVLFDHIHGRAAHRTLFWIEAFAVRTGDGRVDSTCRLHNDDWLEGRDALIEWAQTWRTPSGTTVSARQFLLFEPVEVSQIKDRRMLRAALDDLDHRERPWWRRWFRR